MFETVITSEIRVTIAAMIFESARAGAFSAATFQVLGKYRFALHFVSTIVHECIHRLLFVLLCATIRPSFDTLPLARHCCDFCASEPPISTVFLSVCLLVVAVSLGIKPD